MQHLLQRLERKESSHKGQNGKFGVIGGSRDFSGAPALNAHGALRMGADLVNILTSETVSDVVRSCSENFIVEGCSSGHFNEEAAVHADKLFEWSDAIVVGLGLSEPDESALKELAKISDASFVVDEDAIPAVAIADFSQAVFTPHRGEAEFLREEFSFMESFV